MKKILFFAALSGVFLSPIIAQKLAVQASSQASAKEWKLFEESGEHKIYVRENAASSIKEFRVVDKFEGNFDVLVKTLGDVQTTKHLSENCTEARLVKTFDGGATLQYFYFKMPLGVRDRDILSKVKSEKTDSTYILHSEASSESDVPQKSGVVRLTNSLSSFHLKKLSGGFIGFEYTAFADPNGHIPSGIINSIAQKEARNIVEKLKKLIQK